MDSPALTQPHRRLLWLLAACIVWSVLIFLRLIQLQVLDHSEYARQARQQQEKAIEIPAPRGAIYDVNGSLLARSVPVDSVYLNPIRLPNASVAAEILAPILSLDREQLEAKIRSAASRGRGFLRIKRRISFDEARRLRGLKLDWIGLETENVRHYPKDWLAAHLIGAVDHEERGNSGVEQSLETYLEGRPGAALLLTDVKQRGIQSVQTMEAHAGTPVTLTIDERIQHVAEVELRNALEGEDCHTCTTGTIVVMNPKSGNIVAMASYPGFDPNRPPAKASDYVARSNHAVSVPFEPGSVFKVITLAAALETTTLRPESLINCGGGTFRGYGRVVHEAKKGFGSLTMAQVLEKSSNVGAIQIGLKVGRARLSEYVNRFGFGQKTGVPLPAESAGLVRRLADWQDGSILSIAMGHEVSTTTLQLAQAASVIANGGMLVKPRLVVRYGAPGGNVAEEPTAAPKRILRPETAIEMRKMMEGVVLQGTGTKARLNGWSSGGKTGSAQIFDLEAKRYTHLYNASFMGFAPVNNPALVVVVSINGAAKYGGAVAAPVFSKVAGEALRILDVSRDLPDQLTPRREEPLEVADLAQPDEKLSAAEFLKAEETQPIAAAPTAGVQTAAAAVPAAQPPAPAPAGPLVPDFRGKSVRDVVSEAAALGVPVSFDGSGIARSQLPPAGAVLASGARVKVMFAR